MNAIMNREVSDLLNYQNTVTNENLIKFAKQYYGSLLTMKQQQEICSLPIEDKIWLLEQYKEEIKFNKQPDLSHLY